MKKLCILGSTGSIGTQTLDLVRHSKGEYTVHSLGSGGNSLELFISQINEFKPAQVFVPNKKSKELLEERLLSCEKYPKIFFDKSGLKDFISSEIPDNFIVAVSGTSGIAPALEVLKNKKKLALANKEALVSGGDLIRAELKRQNKKAEENLLMPIDSEHVAIHQCLLGLKKEQVKNIYLTASGGPFWKLSKEELKRVSVKEALRHPTWSMGKKITIDSASMLNKGLEIIEAHRLFDINYDSLKVLVHPQSLIHGLVEVIDGGIISQVAPNDMRLVIQYALEFPERKINICQNFLDLSIQRQLEFFPPEPDKFPCLKLAYNAGRAGKSYPAVLVASGEIAVQAFINEQITFTEIPEIIEKTLNAHDSKEISSLEVLCEVENWAKDFAWKQICEYHKIKS